jgi:hypothetical protein
MADQSLNVGITPQVTLKSLQLVSSAQSPERMIKLLLPAADYRHRGPGLEEQAACLQPHSAASTHNQCVFS